MKCQKCGAELEQGVLFCRECGNKVEAKMFCRECGAELSLGAKFCSSCGADATFLNKVVKDDSEGGQANPKIRVEVSNNESMTSGNRRTTRDNNVKKTQMSKITTLNSNKMLVVVAVSVVVILLLFILLFSMLKGRKKAENAASDLTPTFTATQTGDNTIELGSQYAYMSDEWNVYIAEAVSDSVIKIEHWDKTMNSSKKVKYSEDIGSFKLNDSENGFAWVDDEHTAFTFKLKDKGNSRVKGQSVIFTINISDTDVCKGTDYDESIACYSYQSDDWHNYRAIPLSDKLVKIECWYRGSSLGSFLFGYDMCVLNVSGHDTDFEWNADKSAFTITITDPANKSNWKGDTFVAFTLENPNYSYFSVLDFLGKGTISENKQQKNAFDKNSEVTVGAYSFTIPTYWKADIEEADHYRAYAETSGKVAMLNIYSSFEAEDTVTYESLVNDTESGETGKAFATWFDECGEVTTESFDNGIVKGFTYELEGSLQGNNGKAVIVSFPDEKNNHWVNAVLFETNNTEFSYTDDFKKIMNSVVDSKKEVKSEPKKTDTEEQKTAEEPKEDKKEETVVEEKKENEMPVFAGSSLDKAISKASEYGVTKQFDDDFGHGTHCVALSDSAGGLMIDIIYVTATKEIMCANITTNSLATSSDQKAFVKGMSSVLCPSADKSDVTSWVKDNVGGKKTTIIGGFTYEVSLGPVDNVLYYAGNAEWEEWNLSQ